MVNPDILQRLQNARIKKEKKTPVPLARTKPLEKSKTPIAKGKRPPFRSEKVKGVMAALGPLYVDFLEKKPVCEINSPECTQTATCVHHTAGRGVGQIMNIKGWRASCDACNYYVEKHDQWARDNGHKVSRLAKN